MGFLRRKFMVAAEIIIGLLLLAAIYFIQPYSALKSDFSKKVNLAAADMRIKAEKFTEEDIAKLPEPVKKYFRCCGYIGKQKMSFMKAEFKNVSFSTGVGKPTLKIDYTQYNFAQKPQRFAFIDSSMFFIPFQGFDCFQDGTGSMKGVIAKTFTLFDQRGPDMDKASLVTVLSESLLVPNVALQDYIIWEAVDETHAKAKIIFNGVSAGGVFSFNEKGEMTSFTTDDRTAVDFSGNKRHVKWSAVCGGYRNDNGIKKPSELRAIWHYPEGDQTYFDGKNVLISFY
ncbi:MAG: hypothetical protein Q8878_07875 [Bacillota bacterium]|nr:hypothetical protein [Bacillota bacterium]